MKKRFIFGLTWNRILGIVLSPLMVLTLLPPAMVQTVKASQETGHSIVTQSTDAQSDNLTPSNITLSADNLTAVIVSPRQVDLSWTSNATGLQGFILERSMAPDFSDNVTTTKLKPDVAGYTDDTVLPENTYYYRIFALSISGMSPASDVVSVIMPAESDNQPEQIPSVPQNFKVIIDGPKQVTLSWTSNDTDISGFKIDRATDLAFSENLTSITVGPGIFSYSDSSVIPDNIYFYRIFTLGKAGISQASNSVSVTLPPDNGSKPEQRLPVPQNFTGILVNLQLVSLSWTCNTTEILDFTIERAMDLNFSNNVTTININPDIFSYKDDSIQPSNTYYYRIYSWNGKNKSEFSKIVSVFIGVDANSFIGDLSNSSVVLIGPDQEVEIKTPDEKIKLNIQKGTVSALTEIEVVEHFVPASTGMQTLSLFELNARLQDSNKKITHFNKNIEITITHNNDDLNGIDIESLSLYYLDEETKQWTPIVDRVYDKNNRTFTANINHFSYYGEMANTLEAGPGRVMAADVNLHSGAAVYSYPIEIPPGPGGFQPKLELTYNSGSVDEMKNKQATASWVGTGWSLSLGKITYDLNKREYYLDFGSGSYKLVSTDGINYHTQPEQYSKITRNGNTWILLDRDGIIYQFGGTQTSIQYLANSIYYRWDLSLIQDTQGNQANVVYVQEKRDIGLTTEWVRSSYPEYLRYSDDKAEVHFTLGTVQNGGLVDRGNDGLLRPDNPYSVAYSKPPKIMETRRLDSIEVEFDNVLIRKYVFGYDTTSAQYSTDYSGVYYSGKLRLLSITQKDKNDALSLPSVTFSYQDKPIYRHTNEMEYQGNPGNPTSLGIPLSWPYLVTVNSGYGGSITFQYDEKPDTGTLNYWTREIVETKTVNSGISPNQNYQYEYTGDPQYLGSDWDQEYRGFSEVTEKDDLNNYSRHYYYTTGTENAEKLTGIEYRTQWFEPGNPDKLLKEVNNQWSWVPTIQQAEFSLVGQINNQYINGPRDISFSNDGHLYVTSQYDHSILKFDANGNFVSRITHQYLNNGVFGIDTSSDGYIYAMSDGWGILKFNANGDYIRNYTGNGYYCDQAVSDDGYIYWTCTSTNSVWKLDSNGNVVGYLTSQYINGPQGITISRDGSIYVACYYSNNVVKFNPNGSYVTQFTHQNLINPQFIGVPIGGDDVYVTSDYNGLIFKFDKDGNFINQFSVGHAIDVGDHYIYTIVWGWNTIQLYTDTCTNWAIQLNQVDEISGNETFSTQYVYNNTNGNVVTEYHYGGRATTIGQAAVTSSDYTIWRVFVANTTANILNRPARERVYSGINITDDNSEVQKESLFYYDNGADQYHDNSNWNVAPVKGNLTRLEQKKDSSNSISTYYTYDDHVDIPNEYYGTGNKYSETDPNGNTTSCTYETTYHTYPDSKTSPTVSAGNFTEYYTYDPGTNNLLDQTDINGQFTSYEYDTFKRLTAVIKPNDTSQSPSIQYDYNEWGTIEEQNIETITKIDANSSTWERRFFDGLGRVVQVQSKGNDNNTMISSTTVYNNRGLVDKQYVAQDIDSQLSIYYDTDIANWKSTSYLYDGLGRVITQYNADSTDVVNTYTGWDTLVESAGDHFKKYYYNAFQWLVKIEELEDKQDVYATTTYGYDVLGNLVSVIDDAYNETEIYYNWLSQKTSMYDPDMGYWGYLYDNNGNLEYQTDSNDQTITFVYDALNRLIGKYYDDQQMTDVIYTYDSTSGVNYGLGRRTGMTDATGTTSYKYDTRGRLTEESRTIDSVTYVTSYTYYANDSIDTITYPDTGNGRETVTQQYDDRGMPVSLNGSEVDTLVEDVDYNQLGQITQINLGNGLTTTYGYYGTGGPYDTTGGYYGKLWEIMTAPSVGDPIQDILYTWDAGGNLTQRDTWISSSAETYPPAAVTGLKADNVTATSIRLVWSAPGDDGNTGTATEYDIRYSTSTITANNWASATQVTGEPTPIAAGNTQSFTVTGLDPDTTYYFAIKTADEVPTWSAISNSPSGTTLTSGPVVIIIINDGGAADTTAPAAVSDLSAGSATSKSLTLSWTSPGDNGSTGIATQYDIRYSTATITSGNWASATQLTGITVPLVAGTTQDFIVTGLSANTTYYFALKTADEVPNWSGISNCASATTSVLGPIVVIGINCSPDSTAPAAITDLSVDAPRSDSLRLSWTTPGDDGSSGTAAQYDVRYSTSAITSGNWASATQATGEPAPLPAGFVQNYVVSGLDSSTTYYFAIKTADDAANWSGISNSPYKTTTAEGSGSYETEEFEYDFLDRLITVSDAYNESYEYDTIGNMVTHNGVSYTYPTNGIKPHAVSSVSGNNYVYDNNGNMTTRGSQILTWDVENRVTSITGGASFVYDGDGNRVKKTENDETILYVNKYFEKNLDTEEVTTYYYLGDKLIAKRTGSTLDYIHQDSLNSTSVVSDDDGNLVSSINYLPFGDCRFSQGTLGTDKRFTGQRLDNTGLYYYNARYYDPTIGRFISADPITHSEPLPKGQIIKGLTIYSTSVQYFTGQSQTPTVINPQEHNRYSYALNNPLR